MNKEETKELISNRKAFYDFEILETFEAGLVLQGTEVKSLKEHEGSLKEAYVKILKGEVWLIGCSIPPYRFGNIYNHEDKRDRKLLLHKKEMRKIKSATQERGFTVVPLSLYLRRGLIKIKIATARGKKLVDKREKIKEREEKKKMARLIKRFRS